MRDTLKLAFADGNGGEIKSCSNLQFQPLSPGPLVDFSRFTQVFDYDSEDHPPAPPATVSTEPKVIQKRRLNAGKLSDTLNLSEAAKRCREKRAIRIAQLEKTIAHLENSNADLLIKNAILESQKEQWQMRERDLLELIHNLRNVIQMNPMISPETSP